VSAELQNRAIRPERFSDSFESALIDLSSLTCFQISGSDSASFLQGQLTNNVDELANNQGQLTSYCTPKGRMLAILYLIKLDLDDEYLAILPKEIADSVISRLQMFILRSKVEIKPVTDKAVVGACAIPKNELETILGQDIPDEDYQLSHYQNNVCLKIPGSMDRYLYIGQPPETGDAKVYSDTYWQWLDINSGIPSLTKATQEAFVPQMANMELIDGVSFSKGCYPGQEVVARLHYLGNANRRMFKFECDSKQALNAGDDIYSTGSEQSIGKIVSTVSDKSGHHFGLAIIRIDAVKKNELSVHSTQGSRIKVLPLPYTVPTEHKEKKN
jgi:folate-binding protein YgfZ